MRVLELQFLLHSFVCSQVNLFVVTYSTFPPNATRNIISSCCLNNPVIIKYHNKLADLWTSSSPALQITKRAKTNSWYFLTKNCVWFPNMFSLFYKLKSPPSWSTNSWLSCNERLVAFYAFMRNVQSGSFRMWSVQVWTNWHHIW